MKNIFFTILFLSSTIFCGAQIIFEENFEGTTLPDGWTQMTNATDGGWMSGTSNSLQSQYWPVEDNGTRIMATNDDGCNCDKSADFLIMPPLDLTNHSNAILDFQLFFGKQSYQGSQEEGTIKVSTDGGTTWADVQDLDGGAGWQTTTVSLNDYSGMSDVLVAFHYNDDGGWVYGMAVDAVKVRIPLALDVELTAIDIKDFGETTDVFPIQGTIVNKGFNTITSIDISYSIDGGTPISFMLEGINIETLESYDFTHNTDWIPTEAGTYNLDVRLSSMNGDEDMSPDDNQLSIVVDIFDKVEIPNRIDEFLMNTTPIISEIGSSSDDLDKPTDLDFFPILGKYELWVINERTEDEGGSTVTFFEAGKSEQTSLARVDGNAWHFMSLPTGIAFAESGFFGTSPGVKDANHSGGTFTGPTLWTSDPDIYARPSGGNGSHMDMLHGSPYSMGIAHEGDNAYWLFDGWNNHPVRYDFVSDHGPGADDHSDGRVRRYTEIEVERDGSVPSHLVIDKTTGWLYMNDVGNDRVIRINTQSGTVAQQLNEINEPLAEHSEMGGVEWDVIVSSGLEQPCGIEVIENRLLVGDYATGQIHIYDIDNDFVELGYIETGSAGLTGIKLGPEGNIWYTNRLLNQINKAEPNEMVNVETPFIDLDVRIAPNPTSGFTHIQFDGVYTGTLNLRTIEGRLMQTHTVNASILDMNVTDMSSGMYILEFISEEGVYTEKLFVQK